MYEDPLWQVILYIGLAPLFRILHRDKNNVSLWALAIVSIVCQRYSSYGWGLCWGVLALTLLIFKMYLACGECIPQYKNVRRYNSSYLDNVNSQPTLHLNGKTPFDNGFEYGIIMCEEIIHLIRRFKTIVRPKVPAWALKNINNNLPATIRNEIRGMYEAIDSVYLNEVTYWDILMIQLVPELDNMACTCYAVYDENNQVIFGRNMDWLPFSSAQYSIVVNYKNHGYSSLVVPGLIGCVTAWNSQYVLAMNVVGGEQPPISGELMPSTLFNKNIMIQASTADQANALATDLMPNSSYHLTIADKTNVKSYSYYQGPDTTTHVRELFGNSSLSVLNWTYPDNDQGRYISQHRNMWIKRRESQKFAGGPEEKIRKVLQDCQTFETMHSVIFNWDESGRIAIEIAIDNGFAADLL